jgi:hypothetical protein
MAEGEIPDRIRQFIARHIDSVGQLEALLLLRSIAEPLELARVARRLYINEAETKPILERLCASGLLEATRAGYRYQCSTEELRQLVDELAYLYGRKLIPVTHLIHAKSPRIREFADAFRLKKDT